MRRRAALLLLSLAVMLGACAADRSTGPSQTFTGTWSLHSVNGLTLPYLLAQSGNDTLELLSDVITAADGGTFADVTIIRSTVAGAVTTDTVPDAGSYVVTGSSATLTFNSDSSKATGTIGAHQMTLMNSGVSLIYTR